MISELLNEFIEKSNTLDKKLHEVLELKKEIINAISEDNLKDKINHIPYLKSKEFIQNISENLDLDTLKDMLDMDKIKEILENIVKENFNPILITEILSQKKEFQEHLRHRVSIEVKSALGEVDLTTWVKENFSMQVEDMLKEAMNKNNINKFYMESALSLTLIRLHTKNILVEKAFSQAREFNILKRI